jgi:hypothetical protein
MATITESIKTHYNELINWLNNPEYQDLSLNPEYKNLGITVYETEFVKISENPIEKFRCLLHIESIYSDVEKGWKLFCLCQDYVNNCYDQQQWFNHDLNVLKELGKNQLKIFINGNNNL